MKSTWIGALRSVARQRGAADLHVDAMVADLASTAALARQSRLRVLATSAAGRVAGWEAVPALAEKLPGFEMVG